MKSCGITNIADPILSDLIAKYGAREGFQTYFKVKELNLPDTTIRNKYLPNSVERTTNVTRKIDRADKQPSLNGTTMSIENQLGLLQMKTKDGKVSAYYKTFNSKTAAAKKTTELRKELGRRGLIKNY